MPIRVKNVGHIVGSEIVIAGDKPGDFAAILTNIDIDHGDNGPSWDFHLVIGDGDAARSVCIKLTAFITYSEYERSNTEPLCAASFRLVLFKNQFFQPERVPIGDKEKEEVILRVKRAVYREEEELNALKAYVSNMEAAIEYRKSGPNRIPIPEDVKLAAWARDGGACMRCGSKEKLHFDHVIPVAKGGGNDLENVQILCASCNLKKSDKIAL